MNASERAEIAKLLRMNGKVAHNDLKARAAEQLAVVEQQLSAKYMAGDAAWADVSAAAKAAVKQADLVVAERCKVLGIPEEFRPHLSCGWFSRGTNAEASRRSELRLLAKANIEAALQRAGVEIDRKVAALTTQLLGGAIVSEDGRSFLDALPTIDQLLPPLTLDAVEQIAATPAAMRALGLGSAP